MEKLLQNSGVNLNIGSGAISDLNPKRPGWVWLDMQNLPGVDIIWDMETFPWPLPDDCVNMATASHVLEHIDPHKGVFINVMNEIWRVLKVGGQFAFVVPYAESHGMYQDPTHCNFINETTMSYFDPMHGNGFYQFYRPKPWKIAKQTFSRTGLLECLLEKRPMDKSYLGDKRPNDLTQEDFRVQTIRQG